MLNNPAAGALGSGVAPQGASGESRNAARHLAVGALSLASAPRGASGSSHEVTLEGHGQAAAPWAGALGSGAAPRYASAAGQAAAPSAMAR
eukprot:2472143-Alexandrium_andersonii.AAC.1